MVLRIVLLKFTALLRSFFPRYRVSTYSAFKALTATFVAGTIGLILVSVSWREVEPTWTHRLPGKGHVHALASCHPVGMDELLVAAGCADIDDDEADYHLVALEPDTGCVLWQVRQPMTVRSYINLEPCLAEGEDGHPLLGSQWTAIPNRSGTALAKHTARDGSKLWQSTIEAFAPSAYRGAGFSAIPAASRRGRIWVTGIFPIAERSYERYLALLDGATGEKVWQIKGNSARDVFDSPCEVRCLAAADAIVMAPPHHHERSYPWLLQRISETTGDVIWTQEFIRDNERNLPDIAWVVDEAREQVLVFWSKVVSGKWVGDVISLNLKDGSERWRKKSDFAQTLAGGILAAHMDADGSISLWGREEIRRIRRLWWRWTWDPELPIPLPQHELKLDVRPVRIDLAAVDGRFLGKAILLSDDQSPISVLRDPSSHQPAAMVLRTMRQRDQIEPWSVLGIDGFSLRNSTGGPGAKLRQPNTIVLTRSRRIVTANDPTEEDLSWVIRAW